MKIVNDPGIDRITRDLSGAMWIFARLREDDNSTATFIHRCFQREIWREIRLRDRVVICAVLPAVPFVIMAVTAVFTTLNGPAIKRKAHRKGYHPADSRADRACTPLCNPVSMVLHLRIA